MTRPAVGRFSEVAWSRLPDYMRTADEGNDYAALRLLGAVGDQLTTATTTLTQADPTTSASGQLELASATFAPRDWLDLLASLVGVSTLGVGKDRTREVVGQATTALRRGSLEALTRGVAATLTGSRQVIVETRFGGELWRIRVITFTAETPDPAATEAAAWREKPAGVDLVYQTVAGLTYDQLAAKYPTYDAMTATGLTYAELAADTDPV